MHARFITAVITGLTGGFVVAASQAFAAGTTAWLAFAVGLGLLVLAAVPVPFGDHGTAGLAVDAVTGLLAVWTVVASVVFSGELVKWLSFAEGAGFVLLALGGLSLNQVRLTRRIQSATPLTVAASGFEESEPARRPAAAA
jgi:hypothetical protein